jgi:WD40 repeat protein
MHLCGHRKEVTALCLNHSEDNPLLCSGAEDYIIVWDLNAAQQYSSQGKRVILESSQIATPFQVNKSAGL